MKQAHSVAQTRPSFHRLLQPASGGRRPVANPNNQTVLIGLMVPFMTIVLNFSMFGVALPTIRNTFQLQADTVAWMVTAYMLPFVILMPLYGRLGDGLGKRRLFLMGVVTFLSGTVITSVAPSLLLLMIGRVVQGLGAAGVIPLCIAIISQLYPKNERGKALGTWNSIGPVAGIAGPFLAGLLVDHFGWRTIFGPILLIGLGAFLVVRERVPPMGGNAQPGFLRAFDWGGVALLGAAITALTFYLSSQPITGVAALQDWRLLGITLLLFGTFIIWEKRHNTPFVALEIFTNKTFNLASLCAGIRMFTMSGIGFLMPLYLTDVYGLSAAWIGITLMIHASALLTTMRIGGQLADRWNSHWPVTVGLTMQVGLMIGLALLPDTTPLWLVSVGLIFHGLGAGLSLAALHRASMGKIPQEQVGIAAGLYSMMRFAGTVLGATLAGVVLQQGLNRSLLPIEAYQMVFWLMAGVAGLGVVLGLGLRESDSK